MRWHPNVVLSDFTLPQFDDMEALEIAVTLSPDVPFLVVSGTIGEERAMQALKRGAIDYVLKSNPARIKPAVRRAPEEVEERRARRAAEHRVVHLSRVLQMLSGVNAAVVRIADREMLLANDAFGRPSLAACQPTRRGARWYRPPSRWHVPLI